jgi:hemoglobin
MIKFGDLLRNCLKKKPKTFYEVLGSQQGIETLVQNFYRNMETYPEFENVLHSHAEGITPEIEKKLVFFLCGWLGGPNLFVENYGHPRMRMRHAHIKIGEAERNEWLQCMQLSLDNHPYKIKKKTNHQLMDSFTALAVRIQNAH